jgi:endonuclease/exonuclease/phosphatase family metal-dependent hydrolase
VQVRALTWNLYHGRDFPPDPALFTRRSRVLGITERNPTHAQVNRDLFFEFARILSSSDWDVALLQECPPRWAKRLAEAGAARHHRALTSRNSFAPLRTLLARLNPDLIASNEGGSNLTLVRGAEIVERRELVLREAVPERRALAFTRASSGLSVANFHASTLDRLAEEEIIGAAEKVLEWVGDAPLIFGGDFNVRPASSGLYDELARRFGLQAPTAADAIDHLLISGLEIVEPAHAWPPERREVRDGTELAIRLSDHAPVEATFKVPSPPPSTP